MRELKETKWRSESPVHARIHSIALRLERKSALFFFTEVIWQRFCYNCPFCEKLTNIKPAWNISVFSTGFRVSVFLISLNYFMQVRINFFIWQACWQILHWISILLSLNVGLVLKWQCWCLASHFESLGLAAAAAASRRILLFFATCTYGADFFGTVHNNLLSQNWEAVIGWRTQLREYSQSPCRYQLLSIKRLDVWRCYNLNNSALD